MNSNRRIHLSYRGFTCVLEGFDDPERAARDVGRYLRDLTDEADASAPRAFRAVPHEDGILLRPDPSVTAHGKSAPPRGTDRQERPRPQDAVGSAAGRSDRELAGGVAQGPRPRPPDTHCSTRPTKLRGRQHQGETPLTSPDGDVDRLLARTDARMSDDKVARRLSVLKHLRAAVSQTRPATNQAADCGHAPPEADADEPLILRPQLRVNDSAAQADFLGFCRKHGATSAEDLVEAAVAHAILVEREGSVGQGAILAKARTADESLALDEGRGAELLERLVDSGRLVRAGEDRFSVAPKTRFRRVG